MLADLTRKGLVEHRVDALIQNSTYLVLRSHILGNGSIASIVQEIMAEITMHKEATIAANKADLIAKALSAQAQADDTEAANDAHQAGLDETLQYETAGALAVFRQRDAYLKGEQNAINGFLQAVNARHDSLHQAICAQMASHQSHGRDAGSIPDGHSHGHGVGVSVEVEVDVVLRQLQGDFEQVARELERLNAQLIDINGQLSTIQISIVLKENILRGISARTSERKMREGARLARKQALFSLNYQDRLSTERFSALGVEISKSDAFYTTQAHVLLADATSAVYPTFVTRLREQKIAAKDNESLALIKLLNAMAQYNNALSVVDKDDKALKSLQSTRDSKVHELESARNKIVSNSQLTQKNDTENGLLSTNGQALAERYVQLKKYRNSLAFVLLLTGVLAVISLAVPFFLGIAFASAFMIPGYVMSGLAVVLGVLTLGVMGAIAKNRYASRENEHQMIINSSSTANALKENQTLVKTTIPGLEAETVTLNGKITSQAKVLEASRLSAEGILTVAMNIEPGTLQLIDVSDSAYASSGGMFSGPGSRPSEVVERPNASI